MRKILTKLLPQGTWRYKLAAIPLAAYRRLKGMRDFYFDYGRWIEEVEPTLITQETEHKHNPLISIIVPAFNTPDRYLDEMVDSVIAQTYTNWELCLVQGGSPDPERAKAIRLAAKKDTRIKLIELQKNLGIAGNTNAGIKKAKGEFIAFLDHDDTLAPFALNEVASDINRHPQTHLFYSDEDKLTENGKRRTLPFFKPDWSPDLFYGVNYMAHFVVAEARLVQRLDGIREGFDGSQDYDFLLRVVETKPNIRHIPKILYHWRMAVGSTATRIGEKNYADAAGKKALSQYFERNNIDAKVVDSGLSPTNYKVRYSTKDQPLVSIIIPFKDKADLLQVCVESILEKTTYKNFEILLVSNNSKEKATHDYLDGLHDHPQIRLLTYNRPFNYSAVNNYGRRFAEGKILLFMNNDMEVINPDWLEEMAGVALRQEIGAVGATLLYPDKTVQHAGVVMGLTGMAGHVFRRRRLGQLTPFGLADWPRNYLAVTGACLMVRAEVFDQVNGFDEKFIICGSDVALCLSIDKAGFKNVYWPGARLFHYESVSVGSYANIPHSDYEHSLVYYAPYLEAGDSYYNPNLSLVAEEVIIKNPPAKSLRIPRLGAIKNAIKMKIKRYLQRVVPIKIRQAIKKVLSKLGFSVSAGFSEYDFLANPLFQITSKDIAASNNVQESPKPSKIKTAVWFVPYFDHLAFGGIYTIFRFINGLAERGVKNTIVIYDRPELDAFATKMQIVRQFPALEQSELIVFNPQKNSINDLPPSDIAFCTIWMSAYLLLRYNQTKRKYYFIQDYEPLFYPGGSMSALAESTYRFGFMGIVNTPGLLDAVKSRHKLSGTSFVPAIDPRYYYSGKRKANKRLRIFFYARPNNPRNAFELGILIIRQLIEKYGDKIEIVTAGANWDESQYELKGKITNLGLLNGLNEVGDLYRSCDIGFVYMLSKHPSYQPFEFMACGMATVSNRNEDNLWFLKDGQNCLLAEPSAADMAEKIGQLIEDSALRERISEAGTKGVSSDWEKQVEIIWNDIKKQPS